MKIRLLAIGVILIIALAGISYSYADNVYVSFVDGSVSCFDNDDNNPVKDIGEVTASINDAYDRLTVEVDCAYPGYSAYVEFTIQYLNSDPQNCVIKEVIVDSTFPTDLIEIVVTDRSPVPQSLKNLIMYPGDTIDCLLTINILKTAENEEQQTYPLDIKIEVESL